MLKRRIAASALLAFEIILATFMACQPYECAYAEDSHTTKESLLSFASQTEQNTAYAANEAYCNTPHWYTALKRPEWWQVIVAVIGIAVIAWQANETRKSVKASEKSADAAKTSADALINSERAWIVVEMANLVSVRDGRSEARPVIKNFGKTIARIKKISLGGARPHQRSDKFSEIPVYEGSEDYNFVLCPNCEFPQHEVIVVPISGEVLSSVRTGLFTWYIFGFIEYLDLAEKERSTSFVLVYDPPFFKPYLKAPPDYYKTT